MTQDVGQSTELLEKVRPPSPKLLDSQEISKIIATEKPITHWQNIAMLLYVHISFFPGIHLAFTKAAWKTNLFVLVIYVLTKMGMTAGVHRLWSHRAYKANLPLRVLLMLLFTMAFEGPVWKWARYHRIHHKYQETEADPHNAAEGLWFSHVGWLIRPKHPDVIKKALQTIDDSDLRNDPVVMFQNRFYWPLAILLSLFLPTAIPTCVWGESWYVAWMVAVVVRCVLTGHGTWVINSLAHAYGKRPYDKNIWAAENKITTCMTLGEGWHNYHHVFPWDYRSSEMGFKSFNITKGFIDLFAKIGWAYDLKTVSREMVERRALRTGDGSRTADGEPEVWGWDDPDMSAEQRRAATIIRRKHE